jgi:multidrug transporter EmrE-like cation transporter
MTQFIPLILFTVLTNFLSQIMLKKGMTTVEPFEMTPLSVISNAFTILFNPYVFFGLLVMVISMGSHLVVLSRVDISFAYPFLGLSFVLITAWGYFVLGENVTLLRTAGVMLIVAGVVLVARSS